MIEVCAFNLRVRMINRRWKNMQTSLDGKSIKDRENARRFCTTTQIFELIGTRLVNLRKVYKKEKKKY